jgi:hypothetical protein
VTSSSSGGVTADAFLLNCADAKNGCQVVVQKQLGANGAKLVVDEPKAGDWRVVVRTRESVSYPISYRIVEASLTPSATPIQMADEKHVSGAIWSIALPPKQSGAPYIAFRIAGTPGDAQQKSGLRIAMTPIDGRAP